MPEEFVEKEAIEGAIGRAIWRWHSVEHSLAFAFASVLGLPNTGAEASLSFEIFYAPNNFHVQMTMLDMAIRHRVKDEALLKEWREIRDKVSKVKKWRDACAHCTVAMDNKLGTHVAMVSPFSRKFEKPEGQMTLAELEEAIEAIRQAGIRVAKFQWPAREALKRPNM